MQHRRLVLCRIARQPERWPRASRLAERCHQRGAPVCVFPGYISNPHSYQLLLVLAAMYAPVPTLYSACGAIR